jgi:flagellar protein FlaG
MKVTTPVVTPPAYAAGAVAAAQRRPAASVPAAAQPEQQQSRSEPEPAMLRDAVRTANEAIQQVTNGIEFSVDDDTGKMVVRVIDANTKEVLRQIPSEEMLAIARAIDSLQGLLISQEA